MASDQADEKEQLLLLAGDDDRLPEDGGSRYGRGQAALNGSTGSWKACIFILGTECCEHLSYGAISSNLVTYLTSELHEGNAAAARDVFNWQGACYLTPLIGAFVADSYWGRYWTIAIFSSIYLTGMITVTFSASVAAAFNPKPCTGSICTEASAVQRASFFVGLYMIALGMGGIKPCVMAFGADQFDDSDLVERKKKGSFFNWYFFATESGILVAVTLLVWIQDNYGWVLGFAIPTVAMAVALGTLLSGTKFYRSQRPGGSPLTRVCQVLVASIRKRNVDLPPNSSLLYEVPGETSLIRGSSKLKHTDMFRFLDKAAVVSNFFDDSPADPWKLCTVTQVEELKLLLRIFPIWATTMMFSVVYTQVFSTFLEQGMVLDNKLARFAVPPASLVVFVVASILLLVPIYDRTFVPLARKFTGTERGLSELQRIGIGLAMSVAAMAAAALVEARRLRIAHQKGDITMSILWQAPQYLLVGVGEVFTIIGRYEFFYNQAPDSMRSLCGALSLLLVSIGSYLNSLGLTVVTSITSRGGDPGWVPDDLNEGHLDRFFWLVAALSFLNLLAYIHFAKRFKCKTSL